MLFCTMRFTVDLLRLLSEIFTTCFWITGLYLICSVMSAVIEICVPEVIIFAVAVVY